MNLITHQKKTDDSGDRFIRTERENIGTFACSPFKDSDTYISIFNMPLSLFFSLKNTFLS